MASWSAGARGVPSQKFGLFLVKCAFWTFGKSPPRHRTSTQHESTNREGLAAMYRRLCLAPHPGFAHLRLRHLNQIHDLFSWFLRHTVCPVGAPGQGGCQVKNLALFGEMCILDFWEFCFKPPPMGPLLGPPTHLWASCIPNTGV